MWQSTEKLAEAVADGLIHEGVSAKMFNMKLSHRSDVMTEVFDAKAVVFGSPTLNNGMMPTMADMICYMKGLRPANKIGAAFGSYGWSGEAVKLMNEAMKEMKFQVVDEGVRAQYAPGEEDMNSCIELGRKIGRTIKGQTAGQ
jgi:flavorubredoxin